MTTQTNAALLATFAASLNDRFARVAEDIKTMAATIDPTKPHGYALANWGHDVAMRTAILPVYTDLIGEIALGNYADAPAEVIAQELLSTLTKNLLNGTYEDRSTCGLSRGLGEMKVKEARLLLIEVTRLVSSMTK